MTTTTAPSVADLEKRAADLETKLKALADKPDYSGVRRDEEGRITSEWGQTDESVDVVVPVGYRNDARKAYKSLRRRNQSELKSFGYKPWGEFKSVADFVRTGFESEQKLTSRLVSHYKAIQGMSISDGSGGGVTVMPEFAPGIIDRVYGNDLWSRTDNYAVSGNNITFTASAETSRATGSRAGGVQGYWMNEGGTITKSKPTLREVSLKLHKLAAVVYLTQELIDDTGVALEQYITRKVAEEFNFMIGDGLFNGTGVGQLLGVLNAPSLVSIAKETGQDAATILPENIVKMYSRFYAPNLPRASWFHNQDIGPQLDLMTLGIGAAGIAVYMPPNGLADAPFGTLRGRPLQPTEFNATLGTQGDIVLADLGQVLSISKGGVAQAVSMHVEFLTDQLALRFVMRLAAQPWENAPITPYKGTANTQSSFVALDTRS
jgi:HK97 family phage major capsid protein